MNTIGDQLDQLQSSGLGQIPIPDLWQQEAVAALRAGQDVVVHAPTGAGKTLIFELWSNQGRNRGQAIYTVPTRALANDKLAEWRRKGWNVGIATGDLSDNLDAPVLVATLETQKRRLTRGDGPDLLVVDEYQLLGDPDRGLNYELALAMAPGRTQLLLLSGSVANPQNVVKWLQRLGRKATLIRHEHRPVPLDEVSPTHLSYHVPNNIRGYWPRFVAKALAEDLGPILIFAPRRQAAESMAAELTRFLPLPNPLQLSPAQKALAGERLSRFLKSRIAFHHSGLSYGARAGVIEPLAKAGQLRVVVATMGLAAGINFSLRSVALAGESYRRDAVEQPIRPDEILQMFGRAGRRGLDETGYVLISGNQIRLIDGWPGQLSRSAAIDWSALFNVMQAATEEGRNPFLEAIRVQERLFTTRPIFLGIEESLKHPTVPCGLTTDSERARHVRKRIRQMRNSQGHWQDVPSAQDIPLGQVYLAEASTETGPVQLRPALSEPGLLEKTGPGLLVPLDLDQSPVLYGKAITIADVLDDGRIFIAKWTRRLLNWHGRQARPEVWQDKMLPLLREKLAERKTPLVHSVQKENRLLAVVSLAGWIVRAPVDEHDVALWRFPEREVLPPDCAVCDLVATCSSQPTSSGVALLWRRLGLVTEDGAPTARGQVVSFFSQGYGLAIAAGLEDASYPIEELIYDLANLDAGFRFCGDDNRWAGRMAQACRRLYRLQTIPGYLEDGLPPKYGAGADQVVASVHKNPQNKHLWITDLLGAGDIDRAIIEWRSLLRQMIHAPALEWPRWLELQNLARTMLNETESPTLTDLPPLEYHQTRRPDHRLILRR